MTLLPLVGTRPDDPTEFTRHRARRRTAPPPRTFRPDIEGLRAIAVVLVVLYHAGLAFPGGYVGVDVFFVISGFLITRQLVTMAGRRGLGGLPTFYAHRFRRLLPAAAVVLVVTVLAARVWAPVLGFRDIALDAVFASVYVLNYRLAAQGIDYQHIGAAASPLQHFWSLGVEEQFYFVWPLVVVLVVAVFRRWSRPALVVTVLAIVVLSAHWSADLTRTNAPWAYFSLQTRAWELGVGALIALTATELARVPRFVRGPAAAAGLVAIVSAAVLYSDATAFPGVAAWLPVGGVGLVVAAGCGSAVAAERVLADPLMQCLGKVSYSWYLWHWPLIVITPMALGHGLDVLGRIAIVWVSLAVALLSFFLVEEPARRLAWPSAAWIGAGLGLSGAVVATSLAAIALPAVTTGTGQRVTLAASGASAREVPAAMRAAIAAGTSVTAAPSNLTPQPAAAADSLPPGRDSGCHADFLQVDQGACVFGDRSGDHTVVLFGDSHMEQWRPAFIEAARDEGWKVVSWTKSACPAATLTVRSDVLNREYTECDTWRKRTIERIGRLDPDLVVVSQSETVVPTSVTPASFGAATGATLAALRDVTDARLDYLDDIPIPGANVPECVASHLADVAASCDYPTGYKLPDRHDAIHAAAADDADALVETAPWFCTKDSCPVVVGNVLVYRDDSHMTVPYSRWLAPLARGVLDGRKA